MIIKVGNVIEEGRLGGPQIRIALVAEKLRDYDVHTTVILPDVDSSEFQDYLRVHNVPFKTFPLLKLSRIPSSLIKYAFFFCYEIFLLFSFFRAEKFDIIHVSGGSWQYKGLVAGKLAGCKVLWHLNDTKIPFILKIIFKFMHYFFADAIIVSAERVRKYYLEDLKLKPDKVFEIQAPVDVQRFKPKENNAIAETVKIVSMCNINSVKGLQYFIDAACILNEKYHNLRFIVAGAFLSNKENYTNFLKQKIKDEKINNFEFVGTIKDTVRFLNDADIYVCSSLAEASPLAVWEAMSMALPVVSTDVGDVSRFIRDKQGGFIVDTGSGGKIAEKIKMLLDNPELRKDFGCKNRETAIEKLNISICVKNHYAVYKAIQEI